MYLRKIRAFRDITIDLPGSKSISNRLLVLKYLYCPHMEIENLSEAEDTKILNYILDELKHKKYADRKFFVGNAGTTLRFLTAVLAQQEGIFVLDCNEQMRRRPIKPLVDALLSIGAEIEYTEQEGFPPLKIYGKNLNFSKIIVDGSLSSQYISALLMVAALQKNNVEIYISNTNSSMQYLYMTVGLMREIGIEIVENENGFLVKNNDVVCKSGFTIESDWSAAAVWYAFVSLFDGMKLKLRYLSENSLQGDKNLCSIYSDLGVKTTFEDFQTVVLCNCRCNAKHFKADLSDNLDIVPTLVVGLCLKNISFEILNIGNLRYKECNRIEAIVQQVNMFGYKVVYSGNSLIWDGTMQFVVDDTASYLIPTFKDHRMAMSASIFASKYNVVVENAECVSKSYPSFFADFESVFLMK